MQYWENIEVGNKLELYPLAQNPGKQGRLYLSQVQDILGGGELEILMPMEKGKTLLLPKDMKFIVTFYTSGGMYQGECIVKDRYRTGTIFLLVIQLLSRLSKKQRREFFRLDCRQEVGYRPIDNKEAILREKIRIDRFNSPEEKEECVNQLWDLEEKAEWIPAVMLDISGGGVRLRTRKRENMEDYLMLRMRLYIEGQMKEIDLEVSVVSRANVVNESQMIELRCKYLNITSQRQEMIVRYIFEEQRKMRAVKQGEKKGR